MIIGSPKYGGPRFMFIFCFELDPTKARLFFLQLPKRADNKFRAFVKRTNTFLYEKEETYQTISRE